MMLLTTLIASIAMATSASAEHYWVDFQQATSTFSDGPITVTTSRASTTRGLAITTTSSATVTITSTANDLKGIARVIYHYESSSPTISVSNGTRTGYGSGVSVYTPNVVSSEVSITFTLPRNSPTYRVLSAEIITGYSTQTPRNDSEAGIYEHNDFTREYTETVMCNQNFFQTEDPSSGTWVERTKGTEWSLPSDCFFRYVSSPFVIHNLYGNSVVNANGEYRPNSGAFEISAPAGYAIKGITFVGSNMAFNRESMITSPFGTMQIGTSQTTWTPSDNTPLETVRFNSDETIIPRIGQILITYVSLGHKDNPFFHIDPSCVYTESVQDTHQFDNKDFFAVEIMKGGDVSFSDVTSYLYTIKIRKNDESWNYSVSAHGELTPGGNALFKIDWPDKLRNSAEPYTATITFPEGCITREGKVNRPFSVTYRFAPTSTDCTLRAESGRLNVTYPGIRFIDLNAVSPDSYYFALNSVEANYGSYTLEGIPVHFTDWNLAEGELSWTLGHVPSANSFILVDETTHTIHSFKSVMLTDGPFNSLLLRLETPLQANANARYTLYIPEACVISADGRMNRAEKIGFMFAPFVSDGVSEGIKASPQDGLRISELPRIIVSSTAGGSVEPLKDRTTISWRIKDSDMPWQQTGVTVEENRGYIILELDEPIVAGTQVGPYTLEGTLQFSFQSDFLFTVDGAIADMPSSLNYELVPSDELIHVGVESIYPQANDFVTTGNFHILCRQMDDGKGYVKDGFLVVFPEPIIGRGGQRLNHGDRVWDVRPEAFNFDHSFGEIPNDMADWFTTEARVWYEYYSENRYTYGIFFPMPTDVSDFKQTNTFHLSMPRGVVNVGQGVNAHYDNTWTIFCTHSASSYTFTTPQYGNNYPYLKKLHLKTTSTSGPRGYSITRFPATLQLNCTLYTNDIASSSFVMATAEIDENGEVDITLANPVTVEQRTRVRITIKAGTVDTEDGWTNAEFYAECYVDPAATYTGYLRVENTLPSGATVSIRGQQGTLTADGIRFTDLTGYVAPEDITVEGLPAGEGYYLNLSDNGDTDLGTIVFGKYAAVKQVYFQPEGRVSRDEAEEYGIGMVFDRPLHASFFTVPYNEFSQYVTYTKPDGKAEDLGFYFMKGDDGLLMFASFDEQFDYDYPQGFYTLNIPAGALRFADGSTNGPILYTWEVTRPWGFQITSVRPAYTAADGTVNIYTGTSRRYPEFQDLVLGYSAKNTVGVAEASAGRTIEVQYYFDGDDSWHSTWATVSPCEVAGVGNPTCLLHFDCPFAPGYYKFHILESTLRDQNYLRSHETQEEFEVLGLVVRWESLHEEIGNPVGTIADDKVSVHNLFHITFSKPLKPISDYGVELAKSLSVTADNGMTLGLALAYVLEDGSLDIELDNMVSLPLGTYNLHFNAGALLFEDGTQNPAFDLTATVVPAPIFKYLEVASVRYNDAGVVTDIDPRIDNLAAPLTHFALRYDASEYSFVAKGGVRQFWVAYYEGDDPTDHPYYATMTDRQDFMGRHWLVIDLPAGVTVESGMVTYVIGAEAFKDDNKYRNSFISLVFNVNPTTVNEITDFSNVVLGSHAISGDNNDEFDLNGDGEVTIGDLVRKIDNEIHNK